MTIESTTSSEKGFILRSPSLEAGEMVPESYVFNGEGCSGKNLSPALEWEGAPEGTKSFALTVFDPDAPAEGGWRHWTVLNIPGDIHEIEEGASSKHTLPREAVEVENDFGETQYGGPCPPKGDRAHRYVFTLYALKSDHLNIDPDTDRVTVETSLQNNTLGKATFTVRYAH
ncbi:MAG: YbhB/YbcL family Raf kinase inhibitor-like protein [Bacteriovoracia bacterium]